MDEQLLVTGCKRAESWARKAIYEQYAPIMLGICMRYVNDRETAKDLMQDGFIKVFTKINSYSGKGSFEGWMKRIFVTTALEYLRANDTLKMSVSFDECEEFTDNMDVSVLEHLSADDLMACIRELPKGYRAVFNLFAIEGYTHAEIAKMMEIKEVTSRTQFVRARNLLQKKVQALLLRENGRR